MYSLKRHSQLSNLETVADLIEEDLFSTLQPLSLQTESCKLIATLSQFPSPMFR